MSPGGFVFIICLSFIGCYYFEIPNYTRSYNKNVQTIVHKPTRDEFFWRPSVSLTPTKIKQLSQKSGIPIEIILNTLVLERTWIKSFFKTCSDYALKYLLYRHVLVWSYPLFAGFVDCIFLGIMKVSPVAASFLKQRQALLGGALNVGYLILVGSVVFITQRTIVSFIHHQFLEAVKDREE